MSSQEKIAEVFRTIRNKSEINPIPKWAELRFPNFKRTDDVFLEVEEEKTILLKLEKDGFIKLHAPEFFMDGNFVSLPLPEDIVHDENVQELLVELLPKFNQGFKKYRKYLKSSQKNYWKISHPIWWFGIYGF